MDPNAVVVGLGIFLHRPNASLFCTEGNTREERGKNEERKSAVTLHDA